MNGTVAHSVFKNTSVMIVAQSISWASTFILMLFLPRYLGSEEYGKLFLAVSVTTIFQVVVEFGGGYFIAKEVSRSRDKISEILSNSISFRIILWIASFILMMAGVTIIGYPSDVIALIYILGFSKVWEVSSKVFHSTCQGLEMMQFPAISAIMERMMLTACSVTALLLGAGIVTISIIMALSTLLSFSILSGLVKKIAPFQWAPTRLEMMHIAKASLPYFLWMAFSVAYYRIDAVMLSVMVPEKVVGWYGAAYRFFDTLMFLPSIYSMALFPSLSKLWSQQQDAVAVTTQKSLQFIILAGIPISINVFAFAPDIIELFFGMAEYAPAVILLRIFSAGLLIVYIDFVLGTALFATDRQKPWTIIAFCALLLNPLLNYFFIPYTQLQQGNGGIGAALATLVTELFVMTMALRSLPGSILQNSDISYLYKGCISGAIMIVMVLMFQDSSLPWFVSAFIASSMYTISLYNFKAVEPAELEFMHKFFSLKNFKNMSPLSKEPNS